MYISDRQINDMFCRVYRSGGRYQQAKTKATKTGPGSPSRTLLFVPTEEKRDPAVRFVGARSCMLENLG